MVFSEENWVTMFQGGSALVLDATSRSSQMRRGNRPVDQCKSRWVTLTKLSDGVV